MFLCAVAALAAARPDAEVEADIRARFAKSKISKNNFQVKVKGGTAVLTGQTETIQHKGVATRLAKLGGARAVDNQIRISEAVRAEAAAKLSAARASTRKGARSESRSGPRSGTRSEARREEVQAETEPPPLLAPPPVRRAVIRR